MVSLLVCTAHLLQPILILVNVNLFLSFDLDNVNEELMNASLGTGIDLIPGFLRHTSSSLSFHVLKLLEAIVESSVYPLSWKRSVITPIYVCKDGGHVRSLPVATLALDSLLSTNPYNTSYDEQEIKYKYSYGSRENRGCGR